MSRASGSRSMWAAKLAGKNVAAAAVASLPAMGGNRFRGLVLGIDPSLRGSGLAVVEARGGNELVLHASETLKLGSKLDLPACLGAIATAVNSLQARFPIDHVAVEETIYVQNFRTAQILGMARGAAISAVAMRGLPVYEYPPLRIKQAVAGFGRASKEQVAHQVKALLHLPEALPFDESDAIAVAACHAFTWRPALAG